MRSLIIVAIVFMFGAIIYTGDKNIQNGQNSFNKGYAAGVHDQAELWKKQLIELHRAQYNSVAGAWELKDWQDTVASQLIAEPTPTPALKRKEKHGPTD